MKTIICLLGVIGLMLSCTTTKNISKDYPKHWWTPVAKEKLAWWEIGPQAAGDGEVVLSKRNELGILSNFAHTPFTFRKKKYQGVEGLWQAMKFPENENDPRAKFKGLEWKWTRSQVNRMVSFKAKKAGDNGSQNMKKMGIDWVSFEGKKMPYHVMEKGDHYKIIRAALIAKFKQNKKVRDLLMSTGDLKLIPDHEVSKKSPPAWRYYELWMEIRTLVQENKELI